MFENIETQDIEVVVDDRGNLIMLVHGGERGELIVLESVAIDDQYAPQE